MNKLQELLAKFRNDPDWNTENRDGTHRFDKEVLWIESMFKDYAEKLNMPLDKVVDLIEGKRTYSWPNYYQPANFPAFDSKGLVGVFETFDSFKQHAKANYKGFKCGACGNVGSHPQECIHRIEKDGKCDWTAYGLFKSGYSVIILEDGLKAISIFEPVMKDGSAAKEGAAE
ncbi:MAG: hypothetical protein WC455_22130 [Dehalococcoidia bacterium]